MTVVDGDEVLSPPLTTADGTVDVVEPGTVVVVDVVVVVEGELITVNVFDTVDSSRSKYPGASA